MGTSWCKAHPPMGTFTIVWGHLSMEGIHRGGQTSWCGGHHLWGHLAWCGDIVVWGTPTHGGKPTPGDTHHGDRREDTHHRPGTWWHEGHLATGTPWPGAPGSAGAGWGAGGL